MKNYIKEDLPLEEMTFNEKKKIQEEQQSLTCELFKNFFG